MPHFILPLLLFAPPADPAAEEQFEKRIRPLLAAHCLQCHGEAKDKGGLRLNSCAAALAGGDTGPALVPGDPAKSLLVQAVRYDGDLKMPPKGKLPAEDVAVLEAWVKAGASWPSAGPVPHAAKPFDPVALAAAHWSYKAPLKQAVPAGAATNPIDRFLDAKLKAGGLTPAAAADKRTLIRRLSFDLTGLPPTPAEIAAFLKDDSPAAFDTLVEKYLASGAYGERWGRHWLDLVRYAETLGHEFDFEIPGAFHYRDAVVRAFNADVPFDALLRDHVAGDLLPNPRVAAGTNDSLALTGFWFLGESTHSPVDGRKDYADRIDNMIDVFGKAFLGTTVACARCHDHKFDPVSAADYYGLFGVAASSRYAQAVLDDPAVWREKLDELAPKVTPVELPGSRGDWFRDGPAFLKATAGPPHSGAWADGLVGAVRSPTVTLEKKFVAVRVAGRKAKLRLIVNGLQLIQDPIYGGLKRDLNHGDEFRWVAFDVGMWQGEPAYVELLDDGPGYFAVADVRQCDAVPTAAPTPCPVPPKADGVAIPAARRGPAIREGNGRDERVFVRGNPKTLGTTAPRRILTALPGIAATNGSGRLELAAALTDPTNPLVARVFVNRVWHHHFGVGLVASTDDFGKQGTPPTHPELLDFLATEFIAGGWKIKDLHRRIVSTAAYKRSSRGVPANDETDPQNKLLHRFPLKRLEAEAVRDAILAVSGRLDRTVGGPGVPPFLTADSEGRGKPAHSGPLDGAGRRSIYLQVRRNFPDALLSAFDAPTPFTAIGRRNVSNVPAQALVLLNNPFVAAEADRWWQAEAKRGGPPEARAARMFEAAFGRPPTAPETRAAADFLRDPTSGPAFAHALFNAKEFVFVP